MSTIYLLSNRQRKELLVRHQEMVIALPVPPVLYDPADWARSVLPADIRPLVSSAEEAEVRVRPPQNKAGTPPQNLTDLLGSIQDDRWTVALVVVLVTLRPLRVIGRQTTPQWPANVEIDGVQKIPPQTA